MHPASYFRELRSHTFYKVYNEGVEAGIKHVEALQPTITKQFYNGLLAEVLFYKEFGSKFELEASLDAGNHVDFSGRDGSQGMRIDVTTNINSKDIDDYIPFQNKGPKYYIALMDIRDRKLLELIPLSVPQCKDCGSRLFRVALLNPPEASPGGTLRRSQDTYLVCEKDPGHYTEENDYTFWEFDTFNEIEMIEKEYSYEANIPFKRKLKARVKNHGCDVSTTISKEIDKKIFSCGDKLLESDPYEEEIQESAVLHWHHPLLKKAKIDLSIDLR